jgi:hypothetical protein
MAPQVINFNLGRQEFRSIPNSLPIDGLSSFARVTGKAHRASDLLKFLSTGFGLALKAEENQNYLPKDLIPILKHGQTGMSEARGWFSIAHIPSALCELWNSIEKSLDKGMSLKLLRDVADFGQTILYSASAILMGAISALAAKVAGLFNTSFYILEGISSGKELDQVWEWQIMADTNNSSEEIKKTLGSKAQETSYKVAKYVLGALAGLVGSIAFLFNIYIPPIIAVTMMVVSLAAVTFSLLADYTKESAPRQIMCV